jgi:hypothetical protein
MLMAATSSSPHPFDPLDLQRRPLALFRDLAVLLPNEVARGFVAVEQP